MYLCIMKRKKKNQPTMYFLNQMPHNGNSLIFRYQLFVKKDDKIKSFPVFQFDPEFITVRKFSYYPVVFN